MNKTDAGIFFHMIFLFLTIGASYGAVKLLLTKKYVKDFKQNIIAPLISFIDNSLVYRPNKYVSKESYLASKMEDKTLSQYNGCDFIYGTIDGVNIKFSEISVSVESGNDSKHSFWGIFIVAEFPKHFKAHTLIYSKKGRLFNAEKPSSNYHTITMDSPQFNEEFLVFSTDIIEARYILSPSLMEKIISYNKEMSYPTTLSFVDGKIFIANCCGEVLAPSLQKSLFDFDVAKSYALSFDFAVNVVKSLSLDLKLWSKY